MRRKTDKLSASNSAVEKYSLCRLCSMRFPKSPIIASAKRGGECFICKGSFAESSSLVRSALSQSSKFDWATFSVSSSFKKDILVREQLLADNFSPASVSSAKNFINAALIRELSESTGKKNNQRNAEANFEFNFTSCAASAKPASAYLFGHYLKLSRSHCQSRWHCSGCGGKGCEECGGSGRNYPSVEDEIGNAVREFFRARDCVIHASGREDVDVRMLGHGRPFVLEIKFPTCRPPSIAPLQAKLLENKNVQAIGIRVVGKAFIDAVCGSHFDKEYSALVSADRPLTNLDLQKLSLLQGVTLQQRTPIRVMSRRADLERRRKIAAISGELLKSGKLRIRILAEAGTYIKELINSDQGRTKPSVSSVLGCSCVCDELDVIAIYDSFLETVQ